MILEGVSLKGNVLLQKSFATPHTVPAFLRASALRVVAGSQLLGAVFATVAALVTANGKDRTSCALSAAVCVVAFYHYGRLTKVREQDAGRVVLAKPGDEPTGQAAPLKWAWQELVADAIRYSDWIVTLPPLVVELHLVVDSHTHLFSVAWSCVLVVAMVALGAFTRLGTDELVPPAKGQNATLARLLGFVAFAGSGVCFFFAFVFIILASAPYSLWWPCMVLFVYAMGLPLAICR